MLIENLDKDECHEIKNSGPLVSVLTSVFNGEKFVRASVSSILNQTYSNWELIIVNDGSTDNTLNILEQFKDCRIKIISHSNKGLTKSLNIASSYAKGKYFARQDADDISMPTRLEKQVYALENNPNAVLSATEVLVVDNENNALYEKNLKDGYENIYKDYLSLTNPFVHGSLMFRADAFISVGGYDESFGTSQDFDLVVKLSQIGEIAIVKQIEYKLMIHPESITSRKWSKQIIASLKIRNKLKTDANNAIVRKSLSIIALYKLILKKLIIMIIFLPFSSRVNYLYRIGSIRYQKRDYEGALKYYSNAIRESPLFYPARVKIIQTKIIIRCGERKRRG